MVTARSGSSLRLRRSGRNKVSMRSKASVRGVFGGRSVTLPGLSSSSTVGEAKELIACLEGTPESMQVLHYGKVTMSDAALTLGFYGFPDGGEMKLVRSIKGGHCQVPCGIFDDPAMVESVKEDAATIRKAMVQIGELMAEKQTPTIFNQMVRWVNTKEDHACKIITKMSEYGLCQRCKHFSDPTSPFENEKDYTDAVLAHHTVMTASMKCKQNVDESFCDKLDHAIGDMGKMYTPVE